MDENDLREAVRNILEKNSAKGYSTLLKKDYRYIQPSRRKYPFQFWWDTCFHVFMLCTLGEYDLAKENLFSLFARQKKNGFVGHMIFWQRVLPTTWSDVLQARPTFRQFRPHMSALIQPPLIGQALLRIYEETQDREFLLDMLPRLKNYHRWLEDNRDFEKNGLISIISPFESGMDWKPTFDHVVHHYSGKAGWRLFLKIVGVDLRNFLNGYNLKKIYRKNYFIVVDAGFNTIYAMDLKAMSKLCEAAEDPEALHFKQRAAKTGDALMRLMYDDNHNAFFDLYGHDFKKIKVMTPTIFLPVVLPEIPIEICKKVVEKHLKNKDEFNVAYPIPSVDKNEPSFSPYESRYLWRGPTWVVFNWYLHHSLASKGFQDEADLLMNAIVKLIEKSGFREYYNPFTGEGYGEHDFTWSGLVIDIFHKQDEIKNRREIKGHF